ACALGELTGGAAKALVKLMAREPADAYLTAAALSSLNEQNILAVLFAASEAIPKKPPVPLLPGLITTAIALDGRDDATRGLYMETSVFLRALTAPRVRPLTPWQLTTLASALDALERRGDSADKRVADVATGVARGLIVQAWSTA